jgi:hypothetical protein
MFYTSKMDKFLRFGDVVRGYVSVPTTIKRPVSNIEDVQNFCSISVEVPKFSVVLTPCCSIEDHMLCVTPLIQLRKGFFKNPYFVADFTVINKEIEAKNCYPPDEWEKLELSEKAEIVAKSKPYTSLYLFIYEKNDIFPKYPIRGFEINCYMIDFRNVNTVKCDMIKRAEEMGPDELNIIESKCLQLSEDSRENLRNKMAYYYGRSPEEDLAARLS